MKLLLKILFSCVLVLYLSNSSVFAFHRGGEIDEHFKYVNLQITKDSYLSGDIVNESNNDFENLSFEIFGRLGASSTYNWKMFIKIGKMKAGGRYPILEYLNHKYINTLEVTFKKYSGNIVNGKSTDSKTHKTIIGKSTTNKLGNNFKINGEGSQTTGNLILNKGLNTFQYKHYGNSYFSVYLLDKHGIKIDLIANSIGSLRGSYRKNILYSG